MCVKCVPVVHHLPKFDPMRTSVVSNLSPDNAAEYDSNASDVVCDPPRQVNVTSTAPAQGSALARPVGMKKAKKLANLEQSALKQRANVTSTLTLGLTSSAAALLEEETEMVVVTKELVAVFKANTMLKEKDSQARQEDRWIRIAEMYMSAGQREKGLAVLANLEESTSAISADVPSAINVNGDKNLKDDTNLVLNSISACSAISSAVDGAPQNKDHNDSASSESGDSQYTSACEEKDRDAIAEI